MMMNASSRTLGSVWNGLGFRSTLIRWAIMMLAVLGVACSPSPSSEDTTDTGVEVDLETALKEYGVILLEPDADGVERGDGLADEDGIVRFYSPQHEGLWEFALADQEEAVLPGTKVSLSVEEEGASYLVTDPTGKMAPMAFGSPIPTSSEQLDVSGRDLLFQGGDVFEFDETKADPFFAITGLAFSFTIRGVLMAVGEAAAVMVMAKLVEDTCLYFAPLHDDVCSVVGKVVEIAGSIGIGGVKLVIDEALDWKSALITEGFKVAWDELVGLTCGDAVGGAIVSWIVPSDAETVQDRYREVAYKYNYLLKKIDEAPPEDVGSYQGELTEVGVALTHIVKMVRDHYYELYTDDHSQFLEKSTFGLGSAAVKEIVEIRPILKKLVYLEEGYEELLLITDTSVYYEFYSYRYAEYEETMGSKKYGARALGCALAVAQEVTIGWLEGAGTKSKELSIEKAVGYMLDIVEHSIDLIHEDIYAEDIPDPECLPDLWEPNRTWKSSLSTPIGSTISASGVVTLEELNLCDGATASDEDWYAFPVAMINFDVQGRIRMPDGGEGAEHSVCLELHWYSELYDLGGLEPSRIAGPICGPVNTEFSTWPVSVAQATGVRWRYILARVYPDPSMAVPAEGIDYTLAFTP